MFVLVVILFMLGCASVRTFEFIGVSGGKIHQGMVTYQNDRVKLHVSNFENEYDVVGFHFSVYNKSASYLQVDTRKIYLKDNLGRIHYPLTTDEVFYAVQSHEVYETEREKMRDRRDIAVSMLYGGELPPKSFLRGALYFEPGHEELKELRLLLRGFYYDGIPMDLQDIVFRQEDYHDELKARQRAAQRAKAKTNAARPKPKNAAIQNAVIPLTQSSIPLQTPTPSQPAQAQVVGQQPAANSQAQQTQQQQSPQQPQGE